MPSFDVVSEVDLHEVNNAIDQANREVGTRFDFKGIDAKYTLEESKVTMTAEMDFQCQQMFDILKNKLVKREIDVACMEVGEITLSGKQAKQIVTLRQGIETTLAKKLIKLIKDAKLKVQTAIQGEKVRVTGKKRDDLQDVIALLREADIDLPLQFDNFRD